jgi:Polysaccharide lyase
MGRRNLALLVGTLSVALGVGGSSPALGGNGAAPGQQVPANVSPPSVSGTAQLGSTLSASTGTWTPNGIKYAYEWLRCDSTGANCVAIGGSTGTDLAVGSDLLGATVRVMVMASNQNGTAAATSASTADVTSPIAVPTTTSTTATTTTAAPTTTTATTTTAAATTTTAATATTTTATTTAAATTTSTTVTTASSPYAVEHFDGGLSIPSFWYFSPNGYFLSWPGDGVSGLSARVTPCAAASPGVCSNGTTIADSSTDAQLVGVESTVQSAECALVHAGYGSGDCSTTAAVGQAGVETWYRFHVRFPSGYAPTPGTQNTLWELHVDRGTERDANYIDGSTLLGVAAAGDPSVLCPGSPRFCTTPGGSPHLMLQVAGGLDSAPLYPDQIHRFTAAATLSLGHWYDVVLHFVFSPDSSVGYVQWWVDGVKQVDSHLATQYQRKNGSLGYGEDIGLYNYRYIADWAAPVDYDELSWGPTATSIGFTR